MPGEQIYNSYGDRSNKYLLVNYGFCFPDNRFDSYAIRFRCDVEITDAIVPQMIDFKYESENA